ncbi:MerR family transcriptional regulator [Companilactobacillus sp.]|jgi:DNA-binding transcriptional MerR regulator/effector-binding domain-containing protein|uniref:MerR family transcriptional regulator n=1 Tax=Companilactobacillus sp. TaxID=2767905 RepID=UPI0025BF9F33|nr:MerR family transcriptional regulator [Companilactobacillus sp.]MCH4010282.1 MerR family transcriptional regulator [Companilactobacillus sp.]MCH4052042.1 MerR family transcriptional regulator [Companilactobacillus sp.]MCH4078224.1 MerR family transcriptional regulator [Companilactobacillus sp.]MCH4126800.1 MerR family transcriptional regulator [Companilactobacillus sp.]MCH4132639.1 MerR family transcriptional regulator [Companilactobacillus sp.]
MDELFSIGQLSKLFNIKIPTLRYYDEVGLLKPAKVDDTSHYRYYSTEQFERLNVITYLRALNLSIDAIKDFFEARDISRLQEMLGEQKQQVQQQILALENVNRRIDARLDQVRDAQNSTLDKLELIELPEVSIISLDENYQPTQDIEFPITTLRKKYGLDKNIFLGKIALRLSRTNLLKGQFGQYSGLLLILEPGDTEDATATLSAGQYLRVRFHGTHENASKSYSQLVDYCQKNSLEIVGDAIETSLIDYGITDDYEKYVTEIRVPVIKNN